jgi:predicted flap endonuclease-1-like 5' DNA nuclease
MWDVFLRRWLDMLLWWLPRKKETPSGAGQVRRDRAPEPASRAAGPGARAARAQPAQRPAQAKGGASGSAEPRARLSPKPPAKPEKPEKPVAAPVPDDLTEIKGIGPAVQNKLRALGITTFADLAAADPDQLMARLKGSQPLSLGRVRHWTEAARQRART